MGGITEFRTKDGTYVDCLTEEYAVEVEFDYNWKGASTLGIVFTNI